MEPNLWPADKVERWPIDRLVPYARNARTHSDEQIEQVAASIREWGWTNPVLVGEDGGIIAGHCRVMAGKKLGLAEVPVMLAIGWSEAQKRAYLIADNKLTENAAWNHELLAIEFADLREIGFDIELTGFSINEIEMLGLPDNDALAEWIGMPEFVQNARAAYQTVAIHLKDADAAAQFAELIGQPFTAKTRYIWFPENDIGSSGDKRYVNESAVPDLHPVKGSS